MSEPQSSLDSLRCAAVGMLPVRGTDIGERESRRIAVALGLIAALVLSGCGSQRTTDDIARAAGGSANGVTTAGGVLDNSVPGTESDQQGAAAQELAPRELAPQSKEAGTDGGSPPIDRQNSTGLAVPGAPQSKTGEGFGGQKASGSPIRIGVVGTTSGVGGTQIGTVKAVQVWARMVNARGGVAGHPIEVIALDDGGDPARLRANVQQLVERQKVIAFVGNVTIFTLTQGVVDYLQQRRVPFVGGDRLSRQWLQSPMLFPQAAASGNILVRDIATVAGTGRKKFGFITCTEVQVCRDASRDYPKLAERRGLELVYKAESSFSQPDFTAECVAARNAGAEVLLLATDANGSRRIAASCVRQNYRPQFTLVQTSADMVGDAALAGAIYPSDVFPWVSADTAAAREFRDAISKFAPKEGLSQHWSSGWVAAKLFEKAAAKVTAQPTSEQILQGLWAVRQDTLGGLTAPLTFMKDRPAQQVVCYFPMKIDKEKWTAPQGSRAPVCIDA